MSAPLILASASPRRAELLRFAGLAFEVIPANVDESRRPGQSPVEHASRLAMAKALAGGHRHRLVLGADTTVFIGERIFEKPADRLEAAEHLRALSGRSHQVVTAFCLASGGSPLVWREVISRVCFRALTEKEIEAYAEDGEGLDKAGAYGLQGLGGFLVESIEGSYTNVIGLPLTELKEALAELGG